MNIVSLSESLRRRCTVHSDSRGQWLWKCTSALRLKVFSICPGVTRLWWRCWRCFRQMQQTHGANLCEWYLSWCKEEQQPDSRWHLESQINPHTVLGSRVWIYIKYTEPGLNTPGREAGIRWRQDGDGAGVGQRGDTGNTQGKLRCRVDLLYVPVSLQTAPCGRTFHSFSLLSESRCLSK